MSMPIMKDLLIEVFLQKMVDLREHLRRLLFGDTANNLTTLEASIFRANLTLMNMLILQRKFSQYNQVILKKCIRICMPQATLLALVS